jgi:hypothetical protein
MKHGALIALLIPFVLKSADPVSCPPQVNVRQQLTQPVPGWSVAHDIIPTRFEGITFFDGKPEENASLAPDSEVKRAGKTLSTWTFNPGARPTYAACRYLLTNVMLVRPLPKGIRTCSITYGQNDVIEKIDCK